MLIHKQEARFGCSIIIMFFFIFVFVFFCFIRNHASSFKSRCFFMVCLKKKLIKTTGKTISFRCGVLKVAEPLWFGGRSCPFVCGGRLWGAAAGHVSM